MKGLTILGIVTAALLWTGTAHGARVSLSIDGDSVNIETDTTGVQGLGMGARAHVPLPPDHPLARIPPEAWAKMSPEQIRELAKVALLKDKRGGIFPDPGGKPWNRVEIVVPIVGMVTTFTALVLVVVFVVRYKQSRSRELHEQRLAMIEHGVDPKQFLEPPKPPRTQRMMIWGYILSFGGAGWTIMRVAKDGLHDIGIGPVLALVGVGLIIAARYLEKTKKERESELEAAGQSHEQG